MLRHARLEHRFVQYIPEKLEPGIIYISMEFATAAHACCCGCAEQVITPFTPTDWKLTFDGETVSLWPSIGNWNSKCRSHYFVDRNRVVEALPWNQKRIEAGRRQDTMAKADYYETASPRNLDDVTTSTPDDRRSSTVWARIARKMKKRKRSL